MKLTRRGIHIIHLGKTWEKCLGLRGVTVSVKSFFGYARMFLSKLVAFKNGGHEHSGRPFSESSFQRAKGLD